MRNKKGALNVLLYSFLCFLSSKPINVQLEAPFVVLHIRFLLEARNNFLCRWRMYTTPIFSVSPKGPKVHSESFASGTSRGNSCKFLVAPSIIVFKTSASRPCPANVVNIVPRANYMSRKYARQTCFCTIIILFYFWFQCQILSARLVGGAPPFANSIAQLASLFIDQLIDGRWQWVGAVLVVLRTLGCRGSCHREWVDLAIGRG